MRGEYQTPIGHFSFDFRWEAGARLHLYASNGSGKTSFIHYLKVRQKEFFQARQLRVAFLDQLPLSPLGDLRGRDLLETLSEHLGPTSFDKIFVEKWCRDFPNLCLETPVRLLSGGENQWLKLGIFFAQEADCFILDEPFNYLDEIKQEKIYQQLKLLPEKSRLLMVLHKDLGWQKLTILKKGEGLYELR